MRGPESAYRRRAELRADRWRRLGREMELGYSFSMAIPRPPRLMHYKLDGRRSVPCDSLVEWSMWMAEGDRRVAGTWIDDVRISTVFLGLDHNHALDRKSTRLNSSH